MNHIERIKHAFSLGLKPIPKLDIVSWAKEHVKLATSTRSERAELEQTPWLIEPINKIIETNNLKEIVICAPVGCHSKGTKILMYDGSFKNVEDIKEYDVLIGPDSNPRNVKCLYSGESEMYEITPIKGKPFIVNEEHILSLVRTNGKYGPRGDFKRWGEIVNISVKEYLNKSVDFKRNHKLYRSNALEFSDSYDCIHAYILGLFLGDGCLTTSNGISFTTDNDSLESCVLEYAYKLGMNPTAAKDKRNNNVTNIRGFGGKNGFFYQFFFGLGLMGKNSSNKFIPDIYKTASIETRKELLAGLLDTDGSLGSNCFDYISKSKQLAEDVVFIARSLGLAAYLKPSKKASQNGTVGDYFRVSISGDTDIIPTKVYNKIAAKRKQKKNVLRTGFSVTHVGKGEYYGFNIDGDNLYVMEDFFVTHNSGKTTLNTIVGTYVVAESPKQTMFITQSDPDAQEFMEVSLKPSLEGCSLIDSLWPKEKARIRKDFINFPHMVIYSGGANMTNLQSRSIDLLIADEVWLYKAGMVGEMRKRLHDRPFSKCVLTSQGSTMKDDFHNAYEQCQLYEFCYKASNGEYYPWKWDNLKWEGEKDENGETIWNSLRVWYECPSGDVYEDTVNARRGMAESGQYVPAATRNPLEGHLAFHYNALAVYWVKWKTLVVEFLKAVESKRNYKALEQFKQKRMAEFWSDENLLSENPLDIGEYTLEEARNNLYEINILTADVQKDRIYYVWRTWNKQGASRLVESGMVIDFAGLEAIREKYNIKPKAVFIDCAYRPEDCKVAMAQYGWFGLNGRGEASYTITDKYNRKSKRIYSAPINYNIKTSSGVKRVQVINFSSIGFKDILAMLQNDPRSTWEVAKDAGENYLFQMKSEVRLINKETGKPYYKVVREDNNHLYDCEVQQIVGATLWNCLCIDTTIDSD